MDELLKIEVHIAIDWANLTCKLDIFYIISILGALRNERREEDPRSCSFAASIKDIWDYVEGFDYVSE
jgi:hypothetical protein